MRGVFVGMACLDVVLHADYPPSRDEKVAADRQDITPGGPATNAARTFAALGGESILVTALGSHPVADMLRRSLAADGVEVVDLCPHDAQPPPVASVVVSPQGQRAVVSQSPKRDRVSTVQLPTADVVLCDGHLAQVAVDVAHQAMARQVPVVVDAGRPKPVFDDLFPLASDVICAAVWAGVDVAAWLSQRTRFVAVTAGGDPIRWWVDGDEGEIAVPQVEVRNTLGAGDVLHGGYAWNLAAGSEPVTAAAKAAALASQRCAHLTMGEWLSTLTSASSDREAATPSPTNSSPIGVSPSSTTE